MQKLKTDMLKFTGAKIVTAKDGLDYVAIPIAANNIYVGQKGAYLEMAIHENRDGVDQYGNEGFASVDLGKQRREAGEKGPIVGNWKYVGQKPGLGVTSPEYGKAETRSGKQNGAPPPVDNSVDDSVDDDIPFARPNINWP